MSTAVQPRSNRWRTLLLFLSVIGPGIITANVDNDAGGITTYSLAGAQFGYKLLWTIVPVIIALIVTQEMGARLGAVTGKGLSDLIRERFGVRWTFYILLALFFSNVGNTCAEFSGVAASLEIFGVSKYITVPLVAAFVWWLAVKFPYEKVEKVFLTACVVYICYVVSGFMSHPDWAPIMKATVTPYVNFKPDYISMVIGVVGTTIAPWMQFFIQSAVVDKQIKLKDYWLTRWDVIIGCLAANVVVFFIVVACAETIGKHGITINSAKDAALALAPFAGKWAEALFAFGLFNASVMAASILPLTTSYSICEGMGWESGLNHSFKQAPAFYSIYTMLIVGGALLVLIPNAPLIAIMYWSQVANGILLPFILVFLLLLINRKRLMGEHTNKLAMNVVAGGLTVALVGLTVMLVLTTLFPHLLGG